MNKRALFFFILAGLGLATAWVFNAQAVMAGENYLEAWFTTPADWVASTDLLIAAVAAVAFIIIDSRRNGIRRVWILILLGFVTAIAFVFPLYLAIRELHLAKVRNSEHTTKGRLDEFEVNGRRYLAWVPNQLEAETPVLIAHDAQNYLLSRSKTWNGQNWGVIEALEAGRILPDSKGRLPLIVSVHLKDTAYRLNQLAPEDFMRGRDYLWDAVPAEMTPPDRVLRGNDYIDDVVLNMLPTLEQRYGVKLDMSRTAIAGSSMGGLASLYAMGRHPQVFGAALAYSTHWPIGGNDLVDWLVDHLPADGKHIVWTDRGDLDLDATYETFHERAIARLEGRGFKRDRDFIARVEHGTGHCEDHWARRVEVPINWWASRR